MSGMENRSSWLLESLIEPDSQQEGDGQTRGGTADDPGHSTPGHHRDPDQQPDRDDVDPGLACTLQHLGNDQAFEQLQLRIQAGEPLEQLLDRIREPGVILLGGDQGFGIEAEFRVIDGQDRQPLADAVGDPGQVEDRFDGRGMLLGGLELTAIVGGTGLALAAAGLIAGRFARAIEVGGDLPAG